MILVSFDKLILSFSFEQLIWLYFKGYDSVDSIKGSVFEFLYIPYFSTFRSIEWGGDEDEPGGK